MTTLRGPSRSAVGPVPETDAIVAGQSRYTKVLASGGSFQDVSGVLIGVGQDRPVQSLPFMSEANLLRKAFRYPIDIDFCSNHAPYFALRRSSLPDCWQ